MRTRKDLYGKEASMILRDVSTYHNILKEQLIRLYPKVNPETLEKILYHLQNNRRIYFNKENGIIYDEFDPTTDREMLVCLWVLCDFIKDVEFHSSGDFPVNIIFFSNGKTYDITYVPSEKETLYENVLNGMPEHGKRLIILEDTEQIDRINITDVTAYCTVDEDTGKVEYYKRE